MKNKLRVYLKRETATDVTLANQHITKSSPGQKVTNTNESIDFESRIYITLLTGKKYSTVINTIVS